MEKQLELDLNWPVGNIMRWLDAMEHIVWNRAALNFYKPVICSFF